MKNTILSGKRLPRNIYAEIIASLLLIFFVHTLVSSFIQLQSVKNMLAFYTRNTTFVAWLIIILETIVTALIFFPRTRLMGFIAAILIISCAGIAIVIYPHYPHDFGGIFNNITHNQKWIIIGLTASLSLIGISSYLLRKKSLGTETKDNTVVFT